MTARILLSAALAVFILAGPASAQQPLPSMTAQTATVTRTPL
jgi:hypothetical protein